MGLLRKGGVIGQIIGGVLLAISAIFPASAGFLAPYGYGLLVASSIAAAVDPPKPPKVDDRKGGGGHAFGQYVNAVGSGNVVPVVYGLAKIAPPIVQAFITPVDKAGEVMSGAGAIASKNQALTMMLAVSEGPLPVDFLQEIRLNDQPLYEDLMGLRIGVGDGTRKEFRIPRRYMDHDTIKVYIDGTQTTNVTGSVKTAEVIGKAKGSGKWVLRPSFTHIEDTDSGAKIDMDSIVVTVIGKAQDQVTADDYRITSTAPDRFTVSFTGSLRPDTIVTASYTYTKTSALKLVQKTTGDDDEDKKERGWSYLQFDNAPSNGVVLTCDGRASNFEKVIVEAHRGEINQPPSQIGGNQVRNSYTVGTECAEGTAVEYSTSRKVHDVTVSIAALGGMILNHIGADAGKTSPLEARILINYRKTGDTTWIPLPTVTGGYEFVLSGETQSAKFWEISIRATLAQAWRNGIIKADKLPNFDYSAYDVQVIRTNPSKADAAGRNRDKIWFHYATEILDEELSYPGLAYVVLHAVATEKVEGSIPNVTLKVKGREVKNLDTGTTEWSRNPAWCIADMIASSRWGGGEGEAKLITAEWVAAGAFCDEVVQIKGGGSETRCLFDIVLDRDQDPLSLAVQLGAGAWLVPVRKGNRWGVFIDRARAVDKTYTYVGEDASQLRDSLTIAVESRSKEPSEIEVQFLNAEKKYERDSVLVVPSSRPASRNRITTYLYGVTRRTQAIRRGYDMLLAATLERLICEFVAFPDGAESEAGDVIAIASEVAGETTGKLFRVISVGYSHELLVKMICREYSAQRYASDPRSVTLASGTATTSTNTVNSAPSATASSGDPADDTKGLTASKTALTYSKPTVTIKELVGDYA